MTDLLIRDVSEETIASLDSMARKLGLSRAEYLRRLLTASARQESKRVTLEDLERSAKTFEDLLDEDVMRKAWN